MTEPRESAAPEFAGHPSECLGVRVTGGVIRGVRENGTLAWRGIPYAAPPIGPLRFRAPQPVEPWHGVLDCTRYGKVAPQIHKGQFRGAPPTVPSGEDCLTINVHCPAVPYRKRLGMPVMVFIHGGGYSTGGSADFTGQGNEFVRSGRVIYVSFNYRLGALGYLDFRRYATPDRPIDANLGLRDQVAALQWVRHNIRAFGGNPYSVTLCGESAGANSVVSLMATPSAQGLFARAIAQSPPADAAYAADLTATWAEEFIDDLRAVRARPAPVVPVLSSRAARHPGHEASGSGGLVDLVRSAVPKAAALPPAARPREVGALHADSPGPVAGTLTPLELLTTSTAGDLTLACLALQIRTPNAYPGTFCLAPVVDGDFLPERPLDAFRSGRAHPVPLIIGTNDREGSIFRGRADVLPQTSGRIHAMFKQAPELAHPAMRAAYPDLPGQRAASDFGGDYAFWFPSVRTAELHSRRARVHFYRFDNAPRLMHLLGLDATHGIELYALFSPVRTPTTRTATVLGGREPFASAGERMRRHWLHFACTGTVDATWPAYDESDRLTLIIDKVDPIEADPRGDRRAAWNDFRPGL